MPDDIDNILGNAAARSATTNHVDEDNPDFLRVKEMMVELSQITMRNGWTSAMIVNVPLKDGVVPVAHCLYTPKLAEQTFGSGPVGVVANMTTMSICSMLSDLGKFLSEHS